MKKIFNMRLAALLMTLTLVTSCFVSGTFAKYVTAGSASDTARVAKFGVTVAGTGATFADKYAKNNASFTLDDDTVVSTVKVVAPGTGGTMAAFTITGTPEVAVNVAFTATTVDFGSNWVDAGGLYYCPIEITVGATTLKGTDYTTIGAFEAAITAAIATYKKDYAAGTNLSTIGTDAPVISWAWAFEGNNDVKDTYLGDQAAAGDAAGIEIGVTVTVTQID